MRSYSIRTVIARTKFRIGSEVVSSAFLIRYRRKVSFVIVYHFDIDGTLVSAGGAGKAALIDALAEAFGVAHTLDRLVLSGRTDRAISGDLLGLCGLDDTDDHRARLLAAYLRLLPATLATRPGRVLPGVPRLLDRLAATPGVVVGLITGNVPDGARIKLGHFGLWERFTFGGYGDRHADRDDVARDALAAVERHLGRAVDPRRVRVIGDTPHDVRCARAIGARAVGVLTGWHGRDEMAACAPDLLLDDLSDHDALLALE